MLKERLKFSELIYLRDNEVLAIDPSEKLSKIINSWWTEVMSAPVFKNVIAYCDCGCGGDSYDDEVWEREMSIAYKMLEKIKAFCLENNIDYDKDI
jgi:hypothetical protein